jgi:hypothetical protein
MVRNFTLQDALYVDQSLPVIVLELYSGQIDHLAKTDGCAKSEVRILQEKRYAWINVTRRLAKTVEACGEPRLLIEYTHKP